MSVLYITCVFNESGRGSIKKERRKGGKMPFLNQGKVYSEARIKLSCKIDNRAHNKSIIVYCILEHSTNFAQVIWK
jgi:hypothetical protein